MINFHVIDSTAKITFWVPFEEIENFLGNSHGFSGKKPIRVNVERYNTLNYKVTLGENGLNCKCDVGKKNRTELYESLVAIAKNLVAET
ncbi:MAG TPA: hypothetical protein P5096_01735 [Patescibacteria group bacterium]|nr:hypothetical protein [Patescibacteria group bacterium]